MAKQKDDPTKATYFVANHNVFSFPSGRVVTADELRKAFGKDRDATPEEHQSYQETSLKRLLDLGAITPTEAPDEDEPAPQAAPTATRDERTPTPPKPDDKQPPKK